MTSPGNNNASEFSILVRQLMAREDVQDLSDICGHIFEKAQQLAQEPDEQSMIRAWRLMGGLASQFRYVPAMLWLGDFAENAMNDDESACKWYRQAADQGSGEGAKAYADMLMTGKGVERDSTEAIRYYVIAMEKDVPEAAFVIGEIRRVKGDIEGACAAYQKALDLGYEPAGRRLEQLSRG